MFSTVLALRKTSLRKTSRMHGAHIAVVLCGSALWAQAPDADRISKLERQVAEQKRAMKDWGGLLRYGSENSEVAAPAPGEDRVIFFGDQITEFWNRGKAPFVTGKPWLNRG